MKITKNELRKQLIEAIAENKTLKEKINYLESQLEASNDECFRLLNRSNKDLCFKCQNALFLKNSVFCKLKIAELCTNFKENDHGKTN